MLWQIDTATGSRQRPKSPPPRSKEVRTSSNRCASPTAEKERREYGGTAATFRACTPIAPLLHENDPFRGDGCDDMSDESRQSARFVGCVRDTPVVHIGLRDVLSGGGRGRHDYLRFAAGPLPVGHAHYRHQLDLACSLFVDAAHAGHCDLLYKGIA